MKRYLSRYEIELMQNRLLEEQVERLGGIVESRNQAINDIEAKFTDCLRGYNDNVNSEFSVLNGMLSQWATKVREYQVELMVAAQDDEGSTMRIEELERRKNLAESVAQRIFDKGMIMREESTRTKSRAFTDCWLTLSKGSSRWNVTVNTHSVANHLYAEGREMQNNLELSIMNFRQQSQMVASSNVDLQIASQSTALEPRESREEIHELQQSLGLAQRSIQFNEENVKKVIRESAG